MEPLKIHRPVFDRAAHGAGEYSARMVEHLQETEDWVRTMHEVESEGWGVCQMWVMDHKDGRVANLPDRCPYEQIHRRAEKRQKAWMRYYMKKREKSNQQKIKEMTEKNVYDGAVLFDGNMEVTTKDGKRHTLRIDYLGSALKSADPDKELMLMTRSDAPYCELTTGYLERRDEWEEKESPMFGLCPAADKIDFTLLEYADVVAWGYVDGGLNDKSKFYSCQCTPKQEAELERKREAMRRGEQPEAEVDEEGEEYDGIVLKFQAKDEKVGVQIIVGKDKPEDYVVAAKEHLECCVQNFIDFTEKHPGIEEVQYFTKPTEWEE